MTRRPIVRVIGLSSGNCQEPGRVSPFRMNIIKTAAKKNHVMIVLFEYSRLQTGAPKAPRLPFARVLSEYDDSADESRDPVSDLFGDPVRHLVGRALSIPFSKECRYLA